MSDEFFTLDTREEVVDPNALGGHNIQLYLRAPGNIKLLGLELPEGLELVQVILGRNQWQLGDEGWKEKVAASGQYVIAVVRNVTNEQIAARGVWAVSGDGTLKDANSRAAAAMQPAPAPAPLPAAPPPGLSAVTHRQLPTPGANEVIILTQRAHALTLKDLVERHVPAMMQPAIMKPIEDALRQR